MISYGCLYRCWPNIHQPCIGTGYGREDLTRAMVKRNRWNCIVIWPYMNMWNVHRMFITHIGIPKRKKHIWLLSSGTKLFITFEFKGSSTEGERHNLSMLTFPSAPYHVRTRHKASACKRKSTFFFRRQNPTLTYLKSPQILRARFRCMTSFTSPGHNFLSGIFILTYLYDTSPPTSTPALKFAPN